MHSFSFMRQYRRLSSKRVQGHALIEHERVVKRATEEQDRSSALAGSEILRFAVCVAAGSSAVFSHALCSSSRRVPRNLTIRLLHTLIEYSLQSALC